MGQGASLAGTSGIESRSSFFRLLALCDMSSNLPVVLPASFSAVIFLLFVVNFLPKSYFGGL